MYKCGNTEEQSSSFNFIKRMHLEKTVLGHNPWSLFGSKDASMFLYAYRAFIEALGTGDKAGLKKMVEASLYKRLLDNIDTVAEAKYDSSYFKVADKIKLKLKLLDLQIINGVYIDRTRNLDPSFYDIVRDKNKFTYKV